VRRARTTLERTPEGRRLVVPAILACPAAAAWDALVDTVRWPAWGPAVGGVECDERRIRAGTTGRVRVAGVRLPFEVDSFEDGGGTAAPVRRRWTWSVAGVPATGHRVERVDDDRSRVGFEVSPLAAGYVPVCRRALRNLAGLLE